MATISEKIKKALATIEAVRKDLNALDEAHAEAESLRSVLDGRLGELAEVEGRLARANEEFAKADADHAEWRQATAVQLAEGNARIDQLNQLLRTLEDQVSERRRESESVLQGMQALGARLRAGYPASE